MLSKEQAKVSALAAQLDTFLGCLATARGLIEVIDHVAMELLDDEVTSKAFAPLIEQMDQGVNGAGTAARAALDRLDHVRKALRS